MIAQRLACSNISIYRLLAVCRHLQLLAIWPRVSDFSRLAGSGSLARRRPDRRADGRPRTSHAHSDSRRRFEHAGRPSQRPIGGADKQIWAHLEDGRYK